MCVCAHTPKLLSQIPNCTERKLTYTWLLGDSLCIAGLVSLLTVCPLRIALKVPGSRFLFC